MDKIEMLNSIITLTKKTGQGLALTLIRKASPEYGQIVDDLIKDGKVDIFIVHYGTLPSDEWVVPAGCYSVMKDNGNKHPGALTFIRLYLGIEEIGLNIKSKDILKNVGFMTKYVKWLKDNEQELINLTNMQEIEIILDELDNDVIGWIKSRGWYIDNLTIEKCFNSSMSVVNNYEEQLNMSNDLLSLYNEDKIHYADKIQITIKEIELLENKIKYRKIANQWLKTQTQTENIQTLIK